MSAFGWNYPAGAEHDPRAPYNQHEPDPCERCDGTGLIADEGGLCNCPDCDGTGEEHKPSREEIAIDKADRAMDAAKDERA